MTRKEEREERKRRRELKRLEREERRRMREERKRKKELARQFAEERKKANGKMNQLPQAPKCEVCGYEAWCLHNLEKMMKGGQSEEKEFEAGEGCGQ